MQWANKSLEFVSTFIFIASSPSVCTGPKRDAEIHKRTTEWNENEWNKQHKKLTNTRSELTQIIAAITKLKTEKLRAKTKQYETDNKNNKKLTDENS